MKTPSRIMIVLLIAAGGVALWWWYVGRGPEVTAVQPIRGTAVEIVYATGAVEPVRASGARISATSIARGPKTLAGKTAME